MEGEWSEAGRDVLSWVKPVEIYPILKYLIEVPSYSVPSLFKIMFSRFTAGLNLSATSSQESAT